MRRIRNRETVLRSLVELFDAGHVDPSVEEIAQRAGVSARSVYRYFDDRDHLVRAAISHALGRAGHEVVLDRVGVGSFDERVSGFVDHRLELFGRNASVLRAARVAALHEPLVAEQFETERLVLRRRFLDQFSAEFDRLDAGDRRRIVVAAELPFQFDSLEFLERSTNGSVDEMRWLLVEHLHVSLHRFHHPVS